MQPRQARHESKDDAVLSRAVKEFVNDGGSFRDRVRATSQLVAGILHEFNTPLGALRSAIDTSRGVVGRGLKLIDEHPAEAKRLFSHLDEVLGLARSATDRLVDTVEALAHFARVDRAEVDEVDVAEMVETALRLSGATRSRHITIGREIPAGMRVTCRVREIEHVLYHVIRNATEALEGRDDARIDLRVKRSAAGLIEVVFDDNGPGIAPDVLPTLFEPTLTTKGDTVGLGLSMPTCRYIAQEHGGGLTAENLAPHGARFVFTFREHDPRVPTG